ncbi:hypothetical protein AT864_00983 [Anoxybacillus sp. P3H1B]|nr:hypothetical protein AT864_00983 [Anoxybacillus sp. P3H1B]
MKQAKLFFLILCLMVFVQGCKMLAPEKEVMDALEKMAKYEDKMNEEHEQLVRLEQEQTKLYNEIMDLGMKRFSEVSKLSRKAQVLIEKRNKQIEEEYKNIEKAEEQLTIVKERLSHVQDETMKKQASPLIEIIGKRYDAYKSVYDHYHKALALEKEFYRLLEDEHVTLEKLQHQTDQINRAYKELLSANDQFNHYTEQYNQEKKRLYREWK